MGRKLIPIESRLVEKVRFKRSGCWIWCGAISNKGYGKIGAGRKRGGWLLAHRVAWETGYNQKIPDGLCVLHKCDNPRCVRPSHLFIGTLSDNTRDMIKKGRRLEYDRTGERNPNAKLTDTECALILEMHGSGIGPKRLSEMFGVSYGGISSLLYDKFRRSRYNAKEINELERS